MSEQQQQIQEVLKKSLLKIKSLEAELAKAAIPIFEEVAIVGTGTRFPGGIDSLEKLYDLLSNKQNTITEIPKDRFDIEAYYDTDSFKAGKTNTKYGSFLQEDVRAFDAEFFDITPREAKSIDPLQRMMLEVVYEALEHAGIAPKSLKGTTTDVFVAIGNSDYIQARFRSGDITKMDVYDATGIPFATAAGRISYSFDLQGQCYALDAACSSTLVALHLASQNLRNNRSDTAIVIAANLILTPELYVGLSKLGSLSPSGKCKAFDEQGDGYVRGEGCGVLLLKRTKDAIKENLNIYALVKGTAIKHDGTSNGFTAPNPVAQQSVIKDAIKDAGCQPNDVVFVEAHGIGNKLTDGMELQAISNGYSRTPKYVGSVKPNIGHLEAATGMAMIQKVLLSLEHKTIFPNLYFDTPNTDVDWQHLQLKVAKDCLSTSIEKPLLMAVNLSGYSGTNTHAIFQEPPQRTESIGKEDTFLFTLSTKTEAALQQLCEQYIKSDNWKQNLHKTCYTLQKGRNHYEHRLSVVAQDADSISHAISSYLEAGKSKHLTYSSELKKAELAFLFTGQGSQYFEMGKYLFLHSTYFKEKVEECNQLLQKNSDIDILSIIYGDIANTDIIHQTAYTQPALFVLEYAVAQLCIKMGIRPSVLAGHSIGEYVALTISGALILEDALKIVAERGRLMQSLPSDEGAMLAVLSSRDTIAAYLDQIDIAAINSPNMLTVSGTKEKITEFSNTLKANNIKTVALSVSHAFHSSLMDSILAQFESYVSQFEIHAMQIPVISNLDGITLHTSDLTPSYFSRQLRGTVRFLDNINTISSEYDINTFVECGPNPTLLGFVKSSLNTSPILIAPLKKDVDGGLQWWSAMAQLYHQGYDIDWQQWYLGNVILPLDTLPTYPWQRKIFWENPVRNTTFFENNSIKTDTSDIPKISISKENLMAIMQLEAAHVLGLEPGQKVDITKPLREQGFDSMMSGEYLSRIEKHLHTTLEMSLIHLYGTLELLHRHFIDTYFGGGEVAPNTAVTMNDIMFGGDIANTYIQEDWHNIKDEDAWWLKMYKKIDRKFS